MHLVCFVDWSQRVLADQVIFDIGGQFLDWRVDDRGSVSSGDL